MFLDEMSYSDKFETSRGVSQIKSSQDKTFKINFCQKLFPRKLVIELHPPHKMFDSLLPNIPVNWQTEPLA